MKHLISANRARFAPLLLLATFLGNGIAAAATLQAAAGCAPPPAAGTGNVYYIDPVNGTAAGNGSQALPFNSLAAINGSIRYSNPAWQLPGCNNNSSCTSGPLLSTQAYTHVDPVSHSTVTSANPNAPIQPGDTILLMSGSYGDVGINGVSNPSFITIAAAPGQTPIFSSLQLDGSANWAIQGLTFRALANSYSSFIDISGNSYYGAGHDIIVDSNDLASQDNVDSWLQADWVANARFVAIQIDGGDQFSTYEKCVAITNNSIKNVRWGITTMADNMLVDGNSIDNYGDDALDFAANNLVISHNTITNSHDIGDGNHNDAMQGQIGRGVAGTVFSNITINGNIVIAKTMASLPFPGDLQGIDAFDMDWSNLTVINNVVVSNSWHGMSFYSLHDSLIANNTVLASSNLGTWLGVWDKSHQGTSSNNVVVRNNIASNLDSDSPSATIAFDHNLAGAQISWVTNGQQQWFSSPGTYGNQNVIDANGLANVFVAYNNATSTYDMHLLAGSLAVGTGNTDAPLDMFGYARSAPVDLGAFELSSTTTGGTTTTGGNTTSGGSTTSGGTTSGGTTSGGTTTPNPPFVSHDFALSLGIGDFNGGGVADILWQNDNGQAAVWLMNGATSTASTLMGDNPGPSWHVVSSGDFNGDGMSDILWQNDNGQVAIWLMNGSTLLSASIVGNPGPAWHAITTGDFNGDGKSDILWQNDNGQAAIWLMNGTKLVTGALVGSNPGPSWHIKGAGDFNGDGKSDILWQNDNGQAAIWFMKRTTIVTAALVGANPGTSWHIKGSGDFNGDGRSDILWQNDDGQAAYWAMAGTTVIASVIVGSNPGPDWVVKGAADVNGDGVSDILWQNTNGQAGVEMMGGSSPSLLMVGANPGSSWHMIALVK